MVSKMEGTSFVVRFASREQLNYCRLVLDEIAEGSLDEGLTEEQIDAVREVARALEGAQ